MLLSLLIQPAFPCAGIFHDPETLAESDNQQVVLRALDGEIEVSYNVQYEGDAEDFGWVIPVFGEFSTMEDGDEELFAELNRNTAPVVDTLYANSDEGGGGCARNALRGSPKSGDFSSPDSGLGSAPEIVAEGFTGTYSYTVLEADTTAALEAWLSENGWSIESSRPIIEEYVAEGGVQFVAISLTGAEETDASYLPPVSIRYAGEQLRFPATMARYAMVETLRTTVYVLGEQPATVSGWSSSINANIEGGLYDNPESLFEQALWEAGGDVPGYLLTYAGGHSADAAESVVTRFDTFSSRDAHIIDAVFALDGEGEVETTVTMIEDGYVASEAWLLLPLLAGCGVWRRRRRQG
jgi:hypothetical protein